PRCCGTKNAADEISPSHNRPVSLKAIVSGQLARLKGSMSALGQKQTFSEVCPMSGLPPKRDIAQHACDVCFVPLAEVKARRAADDLEHVGGSNLLLTRLVQLSRTIVELLPQVSERLAAASGYLRTVPLRLSDLATPCFHGFTACGAMPSHLALQWAI